MLSLVFILIALLACISASAAPLRLSMKKIPQSDEEKQLRFSTARARQRGLAEPRHHRLESIAKNIGAAAAGANVPTSALRTVPRVPMVNYYDELYVAEIYMGTPQQGPYHVIMDTGSSNLWIPSVECDLSIDTGCKDKDKYNHAKSSSFQPDACEALFIPYGTGFVIGYLSNDTVTVGGAAVKNVKFGEALWMADFFAQTPIDGILGLAYPDIAADHVTPVFDRMFEEKLVPYFHFGVYLSNKPGGDGSEIMLGGVDERRFEGTYPDAFEWADVVLPSYWLVGGDKFYVDGKPVYHCFESYCPCVIDSGTSAIVGPSYALDPLIKAIGPVKEDCSNFDSLPTIGFSLGGITGGKIFDLSPEYYVLKQSVNGTVECVLLMEASDLVAPLVILGDPMIRAYYTVFDREYNRVGFAKAIHD